MLTNLDNLSDDFHQLEEKKQQPITVKKSTFQLVLHISINIKTFSDFRY